MCPPDAAIQAMRGPHRCTAASPTRKKPRTEAAAGRSARSALVTRSQTRPSAKVAGLAASARTEKRPAREAAVTPEITPVAATTDAELRSMPCPERITGGDGDGDPRALPRAARAGTPLRHAEPVGSRLGAAARVPRVRGARDDELGLRGLARPARPARLAGRARRACACRDRRGVDPRQRGQRE